MRYSFLSQSPLAIRWDGRRACRKRNTGIWETPILHCVRGNISVRMIWLDSNWFKQYTILAHIMWSPMVFRSAYSSGSQVHFSALLSFVGTLAWYLLGFMEARRSQQFLASHPHIIKSKGREIFWRLFHKNEKSLFSVFQQSPTCFSLAPVGSLVLSWTSWWPGHPTADRLNPLMSEPVVRRLGFPWLN